jgi:GH25 family lysozyme M1 (1,4-beta-N-acetylmuramidase)
MTEQQIAALQRDLLRLGYPLPRWGADGRLGPETRAAVALLEQDRRWTRSSPGTVSRLTLERAAVADPYLRGLDVSKHQGHIDWNAVAAAGYRYAYVKTTEGRSYTDPAAREHVKEAQTAGLLVGAYHYWWIERDPAVQARHAAQVAGDLGALDLPLCLDWEQDHDLSPREVVARLRALLDEVRAETDELPVIYTSRRIIERDASPALLREVPALEECPWWMVAWSTIPRPAPPWEGAWSIWQTGPAQGVPGIVGPVDRNLMHPGAEQTLLPGLEVSCAAA